MAEANEMDNEEEAVLEAESVFVLMSQRFRLSRNARAQWYLSHLRSELNIQKYEDLQNFNSDLEAVAVVPQNPPEDWDWDVAHLYKYSVSPRTMVHFLSQTYCFTYLLDLSPSASNPDLLSNGTLVSLIVPALRNSLTSLVHPFFVPGSQLLLNPDIYVTVIAWTPFIAEGAQAVLCQGCLINLNNVEDVIKKIVEKLTELEKKSFEVSAEVNNVMSNMRAEAERLTYGLFEEENQVSRSVSVFPSVATTTADSGFIAMIRTGVLALQLLPRNSSLKIVVITDGMIAAPDINALDNLLSQLRKDTIALSFIKLSSSYHPQSSLARVPYEELMEYMALSTYGAYLPKVIENDVRIYEYVMNIYHEAFLCWGFKKALQGIDITSDLAHSLLNLSEVSLDTLGLATRGRFGGIQNRYFSQQETRFTRKEFETQINSSLSSLLSVRLREGYTVNSVKIHDGLMQVKLTLPWKINSFIHYAIESKWPLDKQEKKSRVQVYLEGGYDTMHDLICIEDAQDTEGFASRERNSVVKKFQMTLKHLQYVDKLLVHFETFRGNSNYWTLPDVLLNKIPVFYIPPTPYSHSGNAPELYIQDFPNQTFLTYWKPVSSLDLEIWHRWLHAHKIHILLNNDYPLPKHLLTPNSSGRYLAVQSRKAGVQLSDCLKRFSSFVLLENTTFIKFLYNDTEDPSIPSSFYIIRMTSKPPCVIIWLAFPGGTPGSVRNSCVKEVTNLIQTLKIKQLQSWRDPTHHHDPCRGGAIHGELVSSELTESPACIQFSKPIERMMIRYDRQPSDFSNILEPAFDSLNNKNGVKYTRRIVNIFGGIVHERPSSGTYLTLSRYLHHRRWIWTVQTSQSPILMPDASITRILSTLLRIRQMEGFTFAYSKNGIQTLMLELPMSMNGRNVSCVVQYVIFPPHSLANSSNMSTWSEDGNPEDSDKILEPENESVQLITEVWIEPQDGTVKKEGHEWDSVVGATFEGIPQVIFPKDNEVISCLLTCEYLSLMCQKKESLAPKDLKEIVPEEKLKNVEILPIQWNLTKVLAKSQPVELLFPMFIQNLSCDSSSNKSNEDLYKEVIERIGKLHDREINLLDSDHEEFTEFLSKAKSRQLKFPQKEPPFATRRSISSKFLLSNSSTKWLCFIKAVSLSRTIVTLLPKSWQDLKNLLVDESNLAGNDPIAVKIVQKPIIPVLPKHNLEDFLNSGDNSNNSSLTNLDSSDDFRLKSGSISRQRKRSSVTTPSLKDEFRKRVFSSDSVQASDRIRAQSMEIAQNAVNKNVANLSAPRARTQTHSQIQRLKNNSDEKVKKKVTEKCPKKSVKKVWGSVTLPIFAFDIITTDVTAQLLHGQNPKFKKHQWASVKINEKTEKEPLSEVEKPLRLHCINLQMVYYRSFVCSAFKSLQMHYSLHSADVQTAVDNCEETIQEIHFTDFLLKACNHVQQDFKVQQIESKEEKLKLEQLNKAKTCSDHDNNHNVIKKKFGDVVSNTFHLVPHSHDLYYYSPGNHHNIGDDLYPVPSRIRRDTRDTTSSNVDDDSHDQNEMIARKVIEEKKFDASSLSLLSNATSEQSDLNESRDDVIDFEPLFLQVSITIRHGKETMITAPISQLPTCLVDLFKTPSLDCKNMQEIDFSQLSVSVDFMSLSLAQDIPVEIGGKFKGLKQPDRNRSVSLCSNLSFSDPAQLYSSDGSSDNELMDLDGQKLPLAQQEALDNLIKDVKWMISDEIAFALTTHAAQIDEFTLKTVAKHIKNSSGKPGCVSQTIPLIYVFGHEVSHQMFLEILEDFSVQGWQKVSVGSFIYFLQDGKDEEPILTDKLVISAHHSTNENNGTLASTLHPHDEVFVWCQDPSLLRKSRPQFWLILDISEAEVAIFFQYREGQFEALLPWRQMLQLITGEIRKMCKKVNQNLLLKDLYENKTCNRLLEPEVADEVNWTSSKRRNSDNEDDEEENITYLEANLNVRFKPGLFACPLVWETSIPLHIRLRESVGNQGSRGLQVTKMVLSAFAVSNRKNMFAYCDDRKNIFYFKIGEIITKNVSEDSFGISRSSSISSASFYEPALNSEDRIELKVFGIEAAGPNIKEDLVQVLHHKLNEKVVEIISTLLQRNPMCKLTPEDVLFLQGSTSLPSQCVRFKVHPAMTSYLEALQYYLRQNVVHQIAIVPKYTSQKTVFRDNVDSIEVPSADIFLYNKCNASGGRRGLACISMTIVDGHGAAILSHKGTKNQLLNSNVDEETLKDYVRVQQITSDSEATVDEEDVILQFRMWEQGRIDLEELQERLQNILENALWEVVTEYFMMPNDITTSISIENITLEPLQTLQTDFQTKAWFDYGLDLKAVSLTKFTSDFISHHTTLNSMKELQRQILLTIQDFKSKAFQLSSYRDPQTTLLESLYLLCNRHGMLPSIGENEKSKIKLHDCYLLIGRNFKHWQACNEFLTSEAKDLAPKEMRPLQRFQPLVVRPSSLPESASSTPKDSIPEEFERGSTFIPRQRLVLAYVFKNRIDLYAYNCSRDIVERLNKQLSNLGHWFSARSALSMSIVSQKLGLFNNQPFHRKNKKGRRGSNPYLGNDEHIESLVKHFSPQSSNDGKNSVKPEDVSNVFCNMRPGRPLQQSPFSIERDVTSRQGRQLLELSSLDRNLLLSKAKKLHALKTDGEENMELDMGKLLNLAHLVHYVYTPLLFLPKWRYQAHSTRLRIKSDLLSEDSNLLPSLEGSAKKKLRFSSIEEREHSSVLRSYIGDFLRYLESQMGFVRVRLSDSNSNKDFFGKKRRSSDLPKIEPVFVKKSVPGSGILFTEVGICEPFVYMKMYALEAAKFSKKSRNGTENNENILPTSVQEKQLTKEIVEIRKKLHMHSFTFDFHLRTIHQLVTGKPTFHKGFNLVMFLDDFMMYYNKGPNFARNAIHSGSISISCTQDWINANQLYNYVLSHEATYHFKVLRMEPIFQGESCENHVELDYALVRHTKCQLSFKFPDHFRNKNTDDVNVTLVVCHDKNSTKKDSGELKLKFYIIISRHEIYPTTYVNTKQSGIFKTVTRPPNAEVMEAVDVIFTGENEKNIKSEAVNYVGYYSTHEQSMGAVMHLQASVTEAELSSVFRKASVHCRRDQLWKSLHDAECDYKSFMELLAFVHTEEIAMSPLLRGRGLHWIRALTKQLIQQYDKNQRVLRKPEEGIEHVIFLSDRYVDMALVITLDLRKGSADFNVINRFAEVGPALASIKSATNEIAEGLYNDVCHHLWYDQLKF